ncbi:MAG: RidA family protein [SAR324 cluster bacterium]|nr:RidA family protein [SAR324 cluster bacterium]MCH8885029.1 RidA family protein [SAR324 cluster bacterium]
MSVEDRLNELGITLPAIPEPVGNYVAAVRTGNLLYLGGQGSVNAEGVYFSGKVGADFTVDEAYRHARAIALQQVAVMKSVLGSLERVNRIVKVLGMVNAGPDFTQHPQVINGFSDTLVEIFGEKGRHARSAVGMGSLPMNIPVEVELIVEVTD